MSKVLWCMNVYDRPVDLKMNAALLKRGLGDSVDIAVFCNCQDGRQEEFKNVGERSFVWKKNTDHHQGTLDSYISFRDTLLTDEFKDHKYIIISHAKTWWTDYSVFNKVLSKMESKDSSICHIHLKPNGAMNDSRYMGLWLDFVMFKREVYIDCISRIKFDRELWAECHMFRCTEHIRKEDRLIIEQCDVPIGQNSDTPPHDKLFDNFIERGHCMLAHYSVAKKFDMLSERSPETAKALRHLLPDDVESWSWERKV